MIYLVYITDTFAGDLNYSWVTKLKVKANSERGAIWKVSRETGLNFRRYDNDQWRSRSGCTGLVIDHNESYDYSGVKEI